MRSDSLTSRRAIRRLSSHKELKFRVAAKPSGPTLEWHNSGSLLDASVEQEQNGANAAGEKRQ